jgi:hypothetical protein
VRNEVSQSVLIRIAIDLLETEISLRGVCQPVAECYQVIEIGDPRFLISDNYCTRSE